MSTISLENRVAALEVQYAELARLVHDQPPRDAWRSVVGIFADDPQIEDLHREVLRIREQDRISTANGEEL